MRAVSERANEDTKPKGDSVTGVYDTVLVFG